MDFKKIFEKVGYFIGKMTVENWVGSILAIVVIFFLLVLYFASR
jgi:hypothetical protein